MTHAIKSFATEHVIPAVKSFGTHVQKGCAKIYNFSTMLDKKCVHVMTKQMHLPRPVVAAIRAFAHALPYIVMLHTLPLAASAAISTGVYIFSAIATKSNDVETMGAGIAFSSSIAYWGIRKLPEGIVTRNITLATVGAAALALGSLLFISTGVVHDILGIPRPQPKKAPPSEEEGQEMRDVSGTALSERGDEPDEFTHAHAS